MRNLLMILLVIVFTTACKEEVLFDFEENLAPELAEINAFLDTNNIDADISNSELRYRITEQGNGVFADSRDSIFMNFQMYFLDSVLIDSNIEEVLVRENAERGPTSPFAQFIQTEIEDLSLILCFEEAMSLASEGASIQMFVPSHLAYGSRGANFSPYTPRILPYTPLLVQIDVLRIVKGD